VAAARRFVERPIDRHDVPETITIDQSGANTMGSVFFHQLFPKGKPMNIVFVGIDLAKNVFAVHGVDEQGKPALVRPSVTRGKLHELIASLAPCTIGMEACSGAHHWARLFSAHGHIIRLMAPKLVAPYRMSGKRGKNDAADAAAICDGRPTFHNQLASSTLRKVIKCLHYPLEVMMLCVRRPNNLWQQSRRVLEPWMQVRSTGCALIHLLALHLAEAFPLNEIAPWRKREGVVTAGLSSPIEWGSIFPALRFARPATESPRYSRSSSLVSTAPA